MAMVSTTVVATITSTSTVKFMLPRFSYLLAGLLPDARLKIYPDSAHGFLFQHHNQFASDVHAFLEEPN